MNHAQRFEQAKDAFQKMTTDEQAIFASVFFGYIDCPISFHGDTLPKGVIADAMQCAQMYAAKPREERSFMPLRLSLDEIGRQKRDHEEQIFGRGGDAE